VKAARPLTAEEIRASAGSSLVGQTGRRSLLFMVFGHQRTGSTLVASRLNSHSRIRCYEEIFLPWVDSEPSLRGWLCDKGYPQWFHFVPGMRNSFLATLTDPASASEDADAIGFKIMYNQLSLWPKLAYLAPRAGRLFEDPVFRRWLHANRVIVIHTLRRNHLKILVSHRLAAESGRFHSRDVETGKRQIVLPVKGLITRLDLIAAGERVAKTAIRDLPSIEVWYEDYVGSQGPAYEARLCRALGQAIPPNGLASALTKVSSDDLRDTVRNYDQVADVLKGTRFEPFLR
jgi:LPS sulfotransferase NodH